MINNYNQFSIILNKINKPEINQSFYIYLNLFFFYTINFINSNSLNYKKFFIKLWLKPFKILYLKFNTVLGIFNSTNKKEYFYKISHSNFNYNFKQYNNNLIKNNKNIIFKNFNFSSYWIKNFNQSIINALKLIVIFIKFNLNLNLFVNKINSKFNATNLISLFKTNPLIMNNNLI